ncbi:alpha/beta hydrolase [Nitriliruptoraceae bacterium ZYF776]|nr:alpha/beta hydrolase [Profundirhabdus halotolerans]
MEGDGRRSGDRGGHVWVKDRRAVAADGTEVAYTVLGDDPSAPWVVLCAGFMCPDNFWAHLAPALALDHRVIVLNYRSIGASSDPRPPGYRARNLHPDDYTMERVAGDVEATLDAEQVDEVVAIGHSMGCQVALQLWRQCGPRVRGLALVTGPYGSPLHTFYGVSLGARLFPLAYHGLPLLPRPVQRLLARAPRLPLAMPVARALRALGPHTPAEGMELYFHHFGEVDPMVALKFARGMHEADAGPWLSEVDVPTLILTGERDTFSPPQLGEAMLAALPDAELGLIHEGTHGALIEFPVEITDRVRDFLHRRLGAPERPAEGDPSRVTAPRVSARPVRPA